MSNWIDQFIFVLPYMYWGLLGSFVGSFLGVVIDRLPQEQSIVWGRSHCDYCKRDLRWFELIPVISFLFQKGTCLRCHKKLSWRYPLLELLSGVMFAVLWWVSGGSLPIFFSALIVACSLFVILFIDLDHMIIPDALVITTAIGAVMYHVSVGTNVLTLLTNNIGTGVVSCLFFYALWLGTKKRGIGFGDVKLSFALGILVGFPNVVVSLYGAFLTGATVAIILLIYGRKTMKSAVPFGPFLIFGAVLSFIVSTETVLAYIL